MLLLVEETIGWIEDRPWKSSPSLGLQRVELSVGEPMAVLPRLSSYRQHFAKLFEVLRQTYNKRSNT